MTKNQRKNSKAVGRRHRDFAKNATRRDTPDQNRFELASGTPFDPSPELLRESNRVFNKAFQTAWHEIINSMIL